MHKIFFPHVIKVCPKFEKCKIVGGAVFWRLVSRFVVRFGQQGATTPAMNFLDKKFKIFKNVGLGDNFF